MQLKGTKQVNYPRSQYKRAVKEWRLRVLRQYWYRILGIAGIFVASVAWMGQQPAYWVGYLTASLAAAVVVVFLSVPHHVSYYEEGAIGEKKTAKALERLKAHGYIVRHSLRAIRGDYDHVVAGPSGVYLIDSKYLGGEAALDGSRVRIHRSRHDEDDYTFESGKKLRGDAADIKRAIQDLTGVRRWVQAVVAFWNGTQFEVEELDKVVYARGSALADWILNQPQKLTPEQYRAAIKWLNKQGVVEA